MWRRIAKKERNEFGWRNWAEIKLAKSRAEWRSFAHTLCDMKHERNDDDDDDDDDVSRKLLSATGQHTWAAIRLLVINYTSPFFFFSCLADSLFERIKLGGNGIL